MAEKLIKERIETVPGVGQVNLAGLARRAVQIQLDGAKRQIIRARVFGASNAGRTVVSVSRHAGRASVSPTIDSDGADVITGDAYAFDSLTRDFRRSEGAARE